MSKSFFGPSMLTLMASSNVSAHIYQSDFLKKSINTQGGLKRVGGQNKQTQDKEYTWLGPINSSY